MSADCPNCKVERKDGATECPSCGVNYDKWLTREAHREVTAANLGAAPGSDSASPARGFSRSVLLPFRVAVAVLWYCAFFPRGGLPVPEGAHKDEKAGFAVVPWPQWEASAVETCGGPAGACVKLDVHMLTPPGAPATAFRVWSTPMQTLLVRKGNKDRIMEHIAPDLIAYFDKTTSVNGEITRVDGLKALRVTVTGTKRVRLETKAARYSTETKSPAVKISDAEYATRDYNLTLGVILVPGKETFYLLGFQGPTSTMPALESAFKSMRESFRVLSRPRFIDYYGGVGGSLASNLILAGLVLLSLVVIVVPKL